MKPRLLAFAKSFGIEDMRASERLPNTRRALAVAEYARDQGKLEPFRHAAMDAYWRGGQNLEDDAVLEEMAREVGLDPKAAVEAQDAPEYLQRVDDARRDANARGVHAIPTFFIDGQRIVGCQPYEVLEAALLGRGG